MTTLNRTLFWLSLSTLVVLSLLPTDQLPGGIFNFWDKAQHALGFGLLTVLALRAYPGTGLLRNAWALLVVGGLVELAQAATTWRTGDWADLLADGVGIVLALAGWRVWVSWARRRQTA